MNPSFRLSPLFLLLGLCANLLPLRMIQAAASPASQPAEAPVTQPKPRVLILGDSISIGYTPFVRDMLKDEAVVLRPMANPRQAENCAGTTKGVQAIHRWLQIDGGPWEVIHFNFGLHDLKRVQPDTQANSNDPTHPPQADLQTYERQLREIVQALKQTGARLIFATTTPVPPGGVKPHRDVADPARYNAVAKKIMAEHQIVVDDLYELVLPRLKEIQQPVNVHFTRQGSQLMAEAVVRQIRAAL